MPAIDPWVKADGVIGKQDTGIRRWAAMIQWFITQSALS